MASLTSVVNEKANLIWSIADKLTGVYKPHEYGLVILPFTVLKRFDQVLEDTKEKVVEQAKKLPLTFAQRDLLLKETAKHNFYNTSSYNFKKLLDDPDNIEENLSNYINGYSKEAKDIIDKFDFEKQITKMSDKGILYSVIEEFNSAKAELHPNKVTNIEMGYIFEEIIRRFSESHNEDAGQHYTPREVIELMVNIIFDDDKELADSSKIKTVYDGACGTGGMLSASMEYMKKLNSSSKMICFGQELNDETYAICKADMLIKGEDSENIRDGNTLSDDKFPGETFDYVIMNPPFGREWKNEKDAVLKETKRGFEGRFGAGTPGISDSQLLFLQNAISKMNPIEKGGGKVAIIHNGSALSKGDAESGESEIRRYIIENDLLDCIIQLPGNLFYNTEIPTYIWILSNRKNELRKNKIQLINASSFYKKMRKSLGKKNCEITKEQIEEITKIYGEFKISKYSKIFSNDEFESYKITIEHPKYDSNNQILKKSNKIVIDKERTDFALVPINQSIESFFENEIRPYDHDAFIDKQKTKITCEILFKHYFYEYKEPRSLKEIENELLEADNKYDTNLKELFIDD